ncbi:MAG: chromosome segregation protein SMC [Candidatus Riflebacteria bacterium]|nr:chromosome segregation protein SMC [Candidatus Riflebacteria bacterium]
MPHVLARELEIDNFKSFGKRTVIPFRPGFTTIFGPNGSGKSNIVDSVLFCLGLSTSKTMRAERLPDLINNISGRKEARVSVRLELTETAQLVEIQRAIRITPSGYASTYYLDGRPVTLAEVHHRLSELQISPSGHNVIMQGDVTRILTMTPLERRRIIDELAGVAEFDTRIEDAKAELAKAERHMEDTQLLLGEIQTRVNALAAERDNAVKYRGFRDERGTLERLAQVLDLQARKKQLALLDHQIQTRLQERAELEDKKAAVEVKIQETAGRMSLLQQEIRAKGEEQRLAKLTRMEELKGELARLEDRRGHFQSIVSEKMERGRTVARDLDSARRSLDLKTAAVGTHQAELATLDQQLDRLKKELAKLHDKISRINQEHADTISEVGRLRGDLQEKKLAEMELRSYRNSLQATLDENRRHASEAQAARADIEAKLANLQTIRADGEQTRASLQSEAAKASTRSELLRQELASKRTQLQETDRQLRAADREHSEAVAKQQALSEGGAGRAMKVLFEAGIRGIRGTVGELARIPKEYAAAIEAAAGRRLEHVVVEDENVGARCIELLKSEGAGRLTFLPLTKIRADTSLPSFSQSGFLGFAVELIEFDPEYRTIFAYVLGRTVIAKTLNVALPMLGRMRTVTLDGDLLEMSGAMTGGSRPQARVRTTRDEVEAKWRRVVELEKRIESLKREMDGADKQLTSVAGYLEETRRSLDKIDVELTRDRAEEAEMTAVVETSKQKLAELAERSASLQKEIEASNRELVRLGQEVAEQEDHLATLDQQLAQLALQDSAAKATRIDGEIRVSEAQSLSLKEKTKALELEIGFLQKNIEGWQSDLQLIETELSGLRNQIEETRAASEALFAEQEKMSGEISELSESVKALKTERDQLSAAQERLKEQREGIEARLFRVEGQLSLQSREFDVLREEVDRLEAVDAQLPPVLVPEGETLASCQAKVLKLAAQMDAMEPVNMLAIEQYDELASRHADLSARLQALTVEKTNLLDRMDQIGKQKLASFMSAFDGINANFQNLYAQMSAGHGKLTLENEEDPFAGGLVIKAQPKDKKMERMEAMSGGEKSLTALAFVFAFQSWNPAPFYVFDEVDSFLDGPNTERLAAMMRSQAEKTQFIVVSHKSAMLERSQRTIGVYQPRNGYSQVKGLELDAMEPGPLPKNVTQLPLPPAPPDQAQP